jgi:hypothetical protein
MHFAPSIVSGARRAGETSCEAKTSKGRLPHTGREVKLKFKERAFERASYYESRKFARWKIIRPGFLRFGNSRAADFQSRSPPCFARANFRQSIAPRSVVSVGFADESSRADRPLSKGIKPVAGHAVNPNNF